MKIIFDKKIRFQDFVNLLLPHVFQTDESYKISSFRKIIKTTCSIRKTIIATHFLNNQLNT